MIPTPHLLFLFRSFLGTILLSGFLLSLGSTMAQQGDSLPQTTSDRAINLKALALQATPLEKEELLVELEAWQELLKAEAKTIAALEIQELSVTPEGKKALLDSLNQKRIERTQVADRMIVIMNAYQTNQLFAVIILLTGLGFSFYVTITGLRRLIIPWHESVFINRDKG